MAKKNVGMENGKIVGKVDAVAYVTEHGYPEVGIFADDSAIKKFYKQLPTEVVEEWCELEGLTFKECPDNESIHRMRACMALLYKHFPKKTDSKAKNESKYSKYSLEDLVNLAIQHEVVVEETDDMRIMRMRLIMALRAHKVIE